MNIDIYEPVVCEKTAKNLKKKGYKQPQPKKGQTWYDFSGNKVEVVEDEDATFGRYHLPNGTTIGRFSGYEDFSCYAPTWEDLFELLHPKGWEIDHNRGGCIVKVNGPTFREETLSETCAKAWCWESYNEQ